MWFQKSELKKKIIKYERDRDILTEFARCVHKPCIEEITLEDVKSYYTALIAPKNALHERNRHMHAVRQFFKYYRGENVLKWQSVTDDPLKFVEDIDMIEDMPKVIEEKRGVGRPRDLANIRKVVALRKEGLTFRQIAQVLKKDPSQIFVWWTNHKKWLS